MIVEANPHGRSRPEEIETNGRCGLVAPGNYQLDRWLLPQRSRAKVMLCPVLVSGCCVWQR